MICPAPCRMPCPLLFADTPRQIHKPDLHQPIMELFRLGSHRDKPNLNRHQKTLDLNQHHLQLCAVCLAACKYQHRKWCHSGDTVNPVWTPASRWKLDPKWLLVVTVCTVCVLDLQAQLSVTFLLLLSDQSADKHPSERFINQNQDRITRTGSLCWSQLQHTDTRGI